MADVHAHDLLAQYNRAWEQAKDILDRSPNGERSAEDEAAYGRANDDMTRLGRQLDEYTNAERQRREAEAAREIIESISGPVNPAVGMRAMAGLERWLRTGDTSGVQITQGTDGKRGVSVDLSSAAHFFHHVRNGMDKSEARAIYTDGGASAGSVVVPQTWAMQIYQYLEAPSALRQLSRVLTTANGDQINFPKTATHGVGTTIAAQGTAIGGTDPVMGTMSLNAFPYGQLVKVSNAAAADIGFDLLGYVAEEIGYAVGRLVSGPYVSGSGSGAPNGIVTAASVGAKTGGSLIAVGGGAATAFTQTLDCLIDLQHSIAAQYRTNASWVMADVTAGTIRKVKDGGAGTVGQYLWVASNTFDPVTGNRMPDTLFGAPIYTDFNMGTNGSAVKPVVYGDFSRFYIRDAGGMRIERSDERYFDTDEIGFRGVLRTDSDLIDTNAIKVLQQAV